MNLSKIKKIVAGVVVFTSFFSQTLVYASQNVNNQVAKNTYNENENVLKVNIDDNGELTYSEPASSQWGDVVYDEDRPFSWDNANVYFVMTDRFVNGDKTNDHSYGRSVGEVGADDYENRQGTFHGGDLKGMTSKIDDGYFDNLGVNAIWITAPYEQIHGAVCGQGFKHYAYHGYYVLDYSNVDANMGTEKDLENFIDTAHTHGIRVIFDIVMNHAGYIDPVTAEEYNFGKLNSNWKDIYYNKPESQYTWDMDYTGGTDQAGGTPGILEYSGDWNSNYWGTDWIRLMGSRFSGNDGQEGAGITSLLSGLPDFKTENNSQVGLPPILKTKWNKEGRYDEEMAELNAYFAKGQDRKSTRLNSSH